MLCPCCTQGLFQHTILNHLRVEGLNAEFLKPLGAPALPPRSGFIVMNSISTFLNDLVGLKLGSLLDILLHVIWNSIAK